MLLANRDGQVFIDDRWVQREQLGMFLAQIRLARPGGRLHLKADRYLPFHEVRQLLREADAAGFKKMTLATWKKTA